MDRIRAVLAFDREYARHVTTNAIVISTLPQMPLTCTTGPRQPGVCLPDMVISCLIHHVDEVEERCTFSGWWCPLRGVSRGPSWVRTASRSSRWSVPRLPDRHRTVTEHVKAYAHDLKDYWVFLAPGPGLAGGAAGGPGRFVAWLALPPAGGRRRGGGAAVGRAAGGVRRV